MVVLAVLSWLLSLGAACLTSLWGWAVILTLLYARPLLSGRAPLRIWPRKMLHITLSEMLWSLWWNMWPDSGRHAVCTSIETHWSPNRDAFCSLR
jgi:hypothetical protein